MDLKINFSKNLQQNAVPWHSSGWLCSLKVLCTVLLFIFSTNSFAQGFTTVDFHQAENKKATNDYNINWVNGILNSTHTDYFEGIGVPQRIVLTGILPNAANSNVNKHSLRFQVLAEKSGKHAYDFPISWEQAFKTAQDIGNGTVNELQHLFDEQCGDAFSAVGKTACNILSGVTGSKVALAEFPDAIGNPGKPALGSPNVDANITCFENYVKPNTGGAIRYGNRTLEIRGNQDIIGTPTITFTGYQGSGKDLAEYLLTWVSSSSQVMIRFATRLAPGSGTCGYGSGQGTGSISGGPYHVMLQRLDDVDNKPGVSLGSQDNQIMSNAVQIPPPTCGLSQGSAGCVNSTTPFTVNYSSTDAAGATVKFYFTANTAGAKLPDGTTAVGSCSSNNYSVIADANGNASISIAPAANTGFTAGSFRVGACVSTGSGSTTCEQPSATTFDAASVVAKVDGNVTTLANPATLNILQSNPSAALTSLASLNATQDNSLFTFSWAVASGVIGNNATTSNLSATNLPDVTFTPTASGSGFVTGIYAFEVTATSTVLGCVAKAQVYIDATGQATCPGITGPQTVCAGDQNLTYTAGASSPGQYLTYVWSLDPVNGASITSTPTEGVSSITVTAGSGDFTVVLKIRADNGQVFDFTGCHYPVTVNPIPSCEITGDDPVCEGSTHTYASSISPTGGTVTHSWSISGNGSFAAGADLTAASVSVVAGSSGSFVLTDNITRNGCPSSCTKTVTVNQCVFPHLFPTQTTCCNYLGGNISSFQLQRACITLSGNKVSNATPGVFFYYGSYTATSTGSTTITVVQSRDVSSLAPFLPQGTGGGNANVLVDNCQTVPGTINILAPTTGPNAGNVTFTFNAVAGHTYVVLVKYDMKSIVGKNAPAPSGSNSVPWATYSFSMFLNSDVNALAGSLGQLPLFASGTYGGVTYTCNPNEQAPTGSCPTTAITARKIPLPVSGQVKELQVAAYPNPYNSNISFQFASPASGKATLEVYDLLGRKLAVVYQGTIDANEQTTVNYKVPAVQHVPMIYKLRVGDKTTYGKLLPVKQE